MFSENRYSYEEYLKNKRFQALQNARMSNTKKVKAETINVESKLDDLVLIYKEGGEAGLKNATNIILFNNNPPQVVMRNAEAVYEGMQSGLRAMGMDRAEDVLDNCPTEEELQKLRSFKFFIPQQGATYHPTGDMLTPPVAGHFQYPDSEISTLIQTYQNRIIFLKFELERRKTIVERKVLLNIIKYAKEKSVVRPPDSQEMLDMY